MMTGLLDISIHFVACEEKCKCISHDVKKKLNSGHGDIAPGPFNYLVNNINVIIV